MPGPNTLGTPNTDDYNLGRGRIFVVGLSAAGLPVGGWRHVGNAPSFNITSEIETLQHFSSMSGLKNLDLEVVLQDVRGLNFELEEANHENLEMFFSGEKATVTNSAVAGFTEYQMVPDGELLAGRWYDVMNSSRVRAYDLDATKIVVKTAAGSPVTLTQGTDYIFGDDGLLTGRIFIMDTAPIQTAITAGDGLRVVLTADAGARTVNEVRALTRSTVEVALKFIAENAVDGSISEYEFHKVKLKAAGDFALISDDWQNQPFEGKCETNATKSPDSPVLSIRTVAAA